MILSYNKKCEALDPIKTYGWSTSNGKPETNATAGCVAAVFEINGTSRPNTFRKDVVAFNANGLGSTCALEIRDGKCFGAPFTPTPMTYAECAGENATSPEKHAEAGSYAKSLGIKYCYYDNDYWAGAVKQCGGVQNMPTTADLQKIANKASQYGLPEPPFWVWTNMEYTGWDAGAIHFDATSVNPQAIYRFSSNALGLCLDY